ncbi:MAG TPA: hypothetical protein VL418_05210, partial [Devosiaceae bacterium]|nr:hypothetical protein [Devosiaceae bacterium]
MIQPNVSPAAARSYTVERGAGSVSISAFHDGASGDLLRLENFGFVSFEALHAAMTQVGANTVINLGNGQTLTLNGVTLSDFTRANVVFDDILPISATANSWLKAQSGATTMGSSKNDSFSGAANAIEAGSLGDDTYSVASNT